MRGEHVEESLLKLVPLGSGTVAAFAGDVELATSCLDFLRDAIPTAANTREPLHSLTLSLGPFPKDRPVELLLAVTDEAGRCELVHWDSVRGLDHSDSDSDYYQIGSLTSYHAALTPALLTLFVQGKLETERMLSVVVAIVQSYGIHDDLVSMNVGGLIFGIQTRLGVVTWQQDTNFVVYSPDFSYRAIITAIARDNTLVLSSSISDDTRVLGHSTSMPGANLWTADWLCKAKSELDSGATPVWVFLSTTGRVITLILRSDVTKDSRYVRLENQGGGKFDLGMSLELMAILQQPMQNRNDGSLPFRLNVRND